jgi:hypothetical protein
MEEGEEKERKKKKKKITIEKEGFPWAGLTLMAI